jgi:hypothetical protein
LLVPVVFESSSVGSFAQVLSALPGSAVNQSTYSSAGNGVAISFQVTSTPYVFDVQETPRFPLQLLAQIGSLLGTILVACKLAMNLVEYCAERRSSNTNTNKKKKSQQAGGRGGGCCRCLVATCYRKLACSRCCERKPDDYVELAATDSIN